MKTVMMKRDEKPCEVVVATFSFGPKTCGVETDFEIEQDGEVFRVCKSHIAQQRANEEREARREKELA